MLQVGCNEAGKPISRLDKKRAPSRAARADGRPPRVTGCARLHNPASRPCPHHRALAHAALVAPLPCRRSFESQRFFGIVGNNVYSSVFAWPCVPFNMSEPQCRRGWRWGFDHLKACRHSEEVDGEPAVGASSAQAGSGNHQAHAVLGPDAVALLMARYRDAARLARHVCKEEDKEVGVGTL